MSPLILSIRIIIITTHKKGERAFDHEELFAQAMDEEVLEQSESFASILTGDMLDWSAIFDDEGEGALYALVKKTQEIHVK